jgi:hypothetical protein
LGEVEAPDERIAIKKAAEVFDNLNNMERAR